MQLTELDKPLAESLAGLETSGNLRRIPSHDGGGGVLDLSLNDYLGIASDDDLRREFFEANDPATLLMSASASRLLAAQQADCQALESLLADLYGRNVLLFNSGWHANTGIIQAIASRGTIVLADKLVHASIIDGVRLSSARMERFRHNDYDHLERLMRKWADDQSVTDILIVAESVYSMDGDRADIGRLAELRRSCPHARLYVDEAHAVGVLGPSGLGLTAGCPDVDIMVGTLGKAYASVGAYAVVSPVMRSWLVNRCRPLIFSTALPPACVRWSRWVIERSLKMDDRRGHLADLAAELAFAVGSTEAPSHIAPLMAGDPKRAVALSQALLAMGFKALPIRTPTVPPGTDRLRFSLSANMKLGDIQALGRAIKQIKENDSSDEI